MRYAIVSLALLLCLGAQEAKVVQLSKADAEHAKAAYDAMKKAQAEWERVRADISDKYASDSQEVTDSITSGSVTLGTSSILYWNGHEVQPGSTETDPCVVYRGAERIDTSESPLCIAYQKVKKDRADKAEREEKERIAKLPKHTVYTPKEGWRNGFEFSPEFQFIVPKAEPMHNTRGNSWLTPSIGTGLGSNTGPAVSVTGTVRSDCSPSCTFANYQ